jgi:nitrate/TMAO reductase-like tetraheme cytochrome c subunit
MEEEHNEIHAIAPPRFHGRLIKVMTLTLFFLILLFSVGFLGLETTSSSKFCASCHEMKPEYYTWKASSHSEVDCVNCHTGSSKEDYAKAKANGLVQVFKKQTGGYIAPIKMPNLITDEACEKCHNMKSRNVTPSGDLIIPHDKHKTEGVKCVECHSGVAHGKIAERKVTYSSDYDKWDDKLGHSFMSDKKYTSPKMDTCMECHEVRKATLECKACHETSMLPNTHKREAFKAGGHGKIQPSDLKKCEQCHSYMSSISSDIFKEEPTYTKFLEKGTTNTSSNNISVQQYAKTNTFCKDCHGQRPKTHKISTFMIDHGRLSEDTKKCFACHENRNTSDAPVTDVQCSSCHQRSHGDTWRARHPFKVEENQKFNRTCLKCHVEKTCTKCHKTKL